MASKKHRKRIAALHEKEREKNKDIVQKDEIITVLTPWNKKATLQDQINELKEEAKGCDFPEMDEAINAAQKVLHSLNARTSNATIWALIDIRKTAYEHWL